MHWFEAIADHAGAAYLRYSFTKGTEQEVDFLVDERFCAEFFLTQVVSHLDLEEGAAQ